MNSYIDWILVISGCIGAVGVWAYTFEIIRGKVTLATKWKDLTGHQLEVSILAVGGALVFLVTLIVGVILKSHGMI